MSEVDILVKERAFEPAGGIFGWLLDQERTRELDQKLAARTAGGQ